MKLNRSAAVGALVAVLAVGGLIIALRPSHPGSTASAAATTAATTAPAPPIVAGAASATLGPLQLTDAYLPQPASSSVAAAYFTIRNTSGMPDTLLKATSSVSRSVGLHDETVDGGVGSMVALSSIAIPAHGSISLVPDHKHLMIENSDRPLKAGDHVTLTLTFAHAGTMTVSVPVVPFLATLGSDDGMSGMTGMS